MGFYSITALINVIASILIGPLVYFKDKKKIVNKTFGLFCIAIVVWSYCYFVWQISTTEQSAIFWSRALMSGAVFITIFYFHFTLALIGKIKQKKKFLIFGYIIFSLFFLSNFTNLFVKSVTPKLGFLFWPNAGILLGPFLAIWFFYALYSVYLLAKAYSLSSGVTKSQLRYVLFGTIIGYLGGATNYLLWYNIPVPPVGNWTAALYLGIVAYAIVVHRLMDIKVALRKSFVYIASVITIVLPAIIISYYSEKIFSQYNTYINLIILIFAVSVFTSVRNYFYKLANKYFFSSLYDSAEVITHFGEKLRSTIEIDKIYNLISDTITDTFHSTGVAILNLEKDNENYKLKFNNGFDTKGQTIFPGNKKLHELFIQKSQPIITEEIKNAGDGDYKETLDILNGVGVALLVPLNIKDETLGLIALGQKEAKDMYNSEDLKTLEIIASQSAISIKNAQLYEETRKFSQTLQKEVERQTAQLKHANEELKILDKAKSNFISIASHQLRTPLTAIKGYISLMLEDTYGKLTKKISKPLENVYLSNERLIRLVNDLLNVSRIEAGKIEMKKEKASVEDIISGIIEELQNIAKSKKLKVEWEKSETALPKISVDPSKIRNAIFNIVDNAIRYTETGGVTLSTKIAGDKLQIRIKDTGPGIEKKELEKLFSSFSRGSAGAESHTEGSGLGLYIAKSFVGMHNGKIWAESEGLGKGSTFVIELPVN